MKLFLAGNAWRDYEIDIMYEYNNKYLLQSYYDLRKEKHDKIMKIIGSSENFLLDSGAFAFMNSGIKVNWKTYADEYINFINKYDIKRYIELDLDHIIGVDETRKLRNYIEEKTAKKSMPVFHAIRGMEYYREMCQEYDYICIAASGMVKGIDEYVKDKTILKQLLKIARQCETKVHGLAYTRIKNLNNLDVPFYSVDSSTWTYGKRYGVRYDLKHGKVIQTNIERGYDYKTITMHNLKTWIKIQHMMLKK